MKNKSKLIGIALVVVLLALAVGYASFSGMLRVSGTASANGNFEVIFTNGAVSTNHGTATVNQADNTKMTADIKLAYPGDGCFVTATVKNNGDVPAKLSALNLYNRGTTTAFSNDDIEVLVPDYDTLGNELENLVLKAGESTSVTFTVKWRKESTAKSATAEFDIQLDYEQATTDFNA